MHLKFDFVDLISCFDFRRFCFSCCTEPIFCHLKEIKDSNFIGQISNTIKIFIIGQRNFHHQQRWKISKFSLHSEITAQGAKRWERAFDVYIMYYVYILANVDILARSFFLRWCIWAISKKDRITISRSIISSWEGKMKFQNLISQSSGAFDHSKSMILSNNRSNWPNRKTRKNRLADTGSNCQIMIRYIWLSNIIEHFWLSQSIFHQKRHFEINSLIHETDDLFWIIRSAVFRGLR